MSPRARDPGRALLAVGAAVAVLLAAGLLPAFGGAAPLEEIASELDPGVDAPDDPDAPEVDGGDGGDGGEPDGDGPSFRFPFEFDFRIGDGDLIPDEGDGSGGDGGSGGPSSGGGGDGGGGGIPGSVVEFIVDLFDFGVDDSEEVDGERRLGDCRTAGEYVVCLPESVHPGRPMPVQVLRDGDPAADVGVSVNGEFVGTTNDRGLVATRAPYTERIRIRVGERSGAVAAAGLAGLATVQSGDDPGGADDNDEGAEVAVDATSGPSIELPPDPDPGERVRVRVAYEDDVGAPAVPVSVDGERVAATDAEGYATVRLPNATRTTLRAERGEVRAERPVLLFDARVTVDGPLGIPLPGAATTVQVTEAGEPLGGATVTVDGEPVGETGHNGTVAATLPLAPLADVAVVADGATHTATQHLWTGPAAATLLLVGAVAGLVGLRRRTGATGRDLASEARVVLQTWARTLADWLVTLAANAEAALAAAAAAGREFVADLEAPAVDLRTAVRARLAALLAWLDPRPRLVAARERLRSRVGRGRGQSASEAAAAGPDGPAGPRDRVERAWARLVARLDLRHARTMTPGQVARRALAAGLPRDAVGRLTRAFRAVEYADADPEAYADEAERAAAEAARAAAAERAAEDAERITGEPSPAAGETDTEGGDD